MLELGKESRSHTRCWGNPRHASGGKGLMSTEERGKQRVFFKLHASLHASWAGVGVPQVPPCCKSPSFRAGIACVSHSESWLP